ncbi:sperm flagellar protein 2 isoform X1 [Heterodontus francisci]|uniref:sperm flagellar protein 2 isoform X1 n=1 Tax=Heterodontus francisci TaxID=7792 RepID=UPI00355BFD7F
MISDNVVQSLVQQEPGVATRLLYQIYIALRRKEKAQLSKLTMETMKPPAAAKLASISSKLYKERLKTMIPREVDVILRDVSNHFVAIGKEIEEQASQQHEEELQKRQSIQEQQRIENLEMLRKTKRKNGELMAKIQASLFHISQPTPQSTARAIEKRKQELRKKEAEMFTNEIQEFEKILKKLTPLGGEKDSDSAFQVLEPSAPMETVIPCVRVEEGQTFIENVRKRLDDDAKARKEREKRRRQVMLDQLQAHEMQEQVYREEQLVNRLMRQSLQERRIAVQLMQVRQEKQVIVQNRIFREKQYEVMRLQEFYEALDREAILEREKKLEHMEQTQRELKVYERIMAERAEERFRKHYNMCQEVVEHIVDLVTKIGEYRELTLNLIPKKIMREWKEMFFHEMALYEQPVTELLPSAESSEDTMELGKQQMLNAQDYEDYKMMTGEWLPPDEEDIRGPPPNNNVLGHVVHRIFEIVNPPKPPTPPPVFPPFPIKACILGKLLAGKSTCLKYLAEALHIRVLLPDTLVQEAVQAFDEGEIMDPDQTQKDKTESTNENQVLDTGSSVPAPSEHASVAALEGQDVGRNAVPSSSKDLLSDLSKNASKGQLMDFIEHSSQDNKAVDKPEALPKDEVQEPTQSQTSIASKMETQPSARAQLGARAAKFLRKGKSIPDGLLVEIVVECVRSLPAECGWILDGFPATINQAKLLEKWLTGVDPDKALRKTKKSKTNLVVDPRAPKDPTPPQPALDIAILLDVSDSTVLTRHSESTFSSGSETESLSTPSLHQESSTHEQEQRLPRLTGFLDNWPKLEKWFEAQQKILVKVNGELEQAELLEKLEIVLVEALYKKQCKDTVTEKPAEVQELPSPTQAHVEPSPAPGSQEKPLKDGKSAKSGSRTGPSSVKEKRAMSISPRDKKQDKSGSFIQSGSRTGLSSVKEKRAMSISPRNKKQDKSGSFIQSGSAKSKKRRSKLELVSPEPSTELEQPSPPPPKPGSDEWVYVDELVPQEVAEYLAPYWNNIEDTYISTLNIMMQELRSEQHWIIQYLHKIRKDFQEYLETRPDHKQEFVSQWQADYNSIAEDLRQDDEMKAELLLRLYNLRECLWDISDNRKEDAERERMNIMGNGWLEDHLGVLLNIYTTFMQVEIDRFQDTHRFLQDYYKGMGGNIPPEESKEFSRIPLVSVADVQLTASVPMIDQETGSAPDSTQPDGHLELETSSPATKNKEEQKDEGQQDLETKVHKVPLVPYRIPSSSLAVKDKGKIPVKMMGKGKEEMVAEAPSLTDIDEYLIFEAYQTATSTLSNIIHREVKIKEDEEKKEQKLKEEKEKELQKSAGKDGKKKGGRSADKKKGRRSTTPSVPPTVIENPEQLKKRELRERIYTEYFGALEDEAHVVRTRLEMIKLKAMAVVQDLKSKAQEVFTLMEDWLGTRFLQEMESISTLLDVGLGHVDAGTKIEQQLVLHSKEFFVNGDVKMVPDPQPLTRLPSKEIPKDGELTIEQLSNLHRQFMLIAPTGLMTKKALIEILQDLVSLDLGSDQLPDPWSSISYLQVLDITRMLAAESDLVDWRQFLLSAAQPWPYPSLKELLDTKSRFQAIDQAGTSCVTQEQYDQVELWFKGETELQVPEDPVAPLLFQRLGQLKKVFFTVFADESRMPPELDYNNMLLYFAAHHDPVQGFHRSLSLATGTLLPWIPASTSSLVKSEPCIDGRTTKRTLVAKDVQEVPALSAAKVPVSALYQIMTHGVCKSGDTHRHSSQYEVEQLHCKHLTQIYKELGSKNLEPVPFESLMKHPFIMDLIKSTLKFTLHDFQAILQRKPVESEIIASSSPELSVETSSNTPPEDTGTSRRRIPKT